MKFSLIAGEIWYDTIAISWNVTHAFTVQSTPEYLSKRNESICSYKMLCINVHIESSKPGKKQVCFNRQAQKHTGEICFIL